MDTQKSAKLAEMSYEIGKTKVKKRIPNAIENVNDHLKDCLLYTSPSPRDRTRSRMPSSA